MPRYRSSSTSSTSSASTGTISENAVVYRSAGGHSHDGLNSSLIDMSKYTVWDFDISTIYTNNSRYNTQLSNVDRFKNFITNHVANDVLGPAGITLGDNIINASNIIAGSITTDLLATNAITSLNYSYTSGNFTDSGSFLNLADGSIRTDSFYLDGAGNMYIAGDVVIGATAASTIESGSASGATSLQPGEAANDVNSNTTTISGGKIRTGEIESTGFSWNGSATFSTTGTRIDLDDGQIIGKQFRIDSSGNATFAGAVSGATITIGSGNNIFRVNSSGDMWIGHATETSAEFRVLNNGTMYATAGTVGGITMASNKLYTGTGTYGNTNTGFYLDNSGNLSLKDKLTWNGTTLTVSGTINASAGTFSGNITSTATISGGVLSLNSDKVRLDPSITFNDGSSSGTVSALRIHNNTNSSSVSEIANGIYFQDPTTSSIFSKISGNTWLGVARLDILGPRNSYGHPRIMLSQDGVYAFFDKAGYPYYESYIALTSTATIGISNGTQFQAHDTYAQINKTLYLSSSGNNILYNPNSTTSGNGYIRIGSDDEWATPITINTTHAGLSGIRYMISFYHNNANKGSISHNGSNTAYNTSSDYRLKENVETIYDGLEKVKQIKPRYYNFIGNSEAGRQAGFIAHELQEAVPHAAFGEKDAVDENGEPVLQQIEKAAIVPYLVAAIQELSDKIDDLRAQIQSFSN